MMKTGDSFSKNAIEKTSLNFAELREKGIKYLQELGGDIWTDYNLHDPGLTILDQLCYGLTDIGYRTAYPVEDLLVTSKGTPIDAFANAFFSPSDIFSSHPVTETDLRKLIIDRFEEIQNVWITYLKNDGLQEAVNGLIRIEILPKLSFVRQFSSDQNAKTKFLERMENFLNSNRNIGEYFADVCLLAPQPIAISYDVHLREQSDTEHTLANLFLSLFEYLYVPVQFKTSEEVFNDNRTIDDIYAGPNLNRGFQTDIPADDRVRTLDIGVLQKLFSKIDGIEKCVVRNIICHEKETPTVNVGNDHFFHLLNENSNYSSKSRFENLYSKLKVYINGKEINVLHKDVINSLLFENWSKKYRGYSIENQKEKAFTATLKKTYRNPGNYQSIQKHFPLIYNIGPEGLADSEPEEKKAKAAQLKAFLMLFEQHFAGHLSQLANLSNFFDIDLKSIEEPALKNNWIKSVPNWTNLFPDKEIHETGFESIEAHLKKKNAVYDHLLARFGEELNEVPWKIATRLHLLKTERDYLMAVTSSKSLFLRNLDRISYNRTKAGSFFSDQNHVSGLEELICMKTGIPQNNKPIVKKLTLQHAESLSPGERYHDINELNSKYRSVRAAELSTSSEESNPLDLSSSFGAIGVKSLFRDTVNIENYRISKKAEDEGGRFHVIFRKGKGKWVRLYECQNEPDAIRFVAQSIDYFIKLNHNAEGFYMVDHILLHEILAESKFGFSFQDEYGNDFFCTTSENSWSKTNEDRQNQVQEFFLYGIEPDNYQLKDNKWQLMNGEGKTIATSPLLTNSDISDIDLLVEKVKSYIRFFSFSDVKSGARRYAEMEKIRLMGSIAGQKFGQRKLVFQRKLSNDKIVNEDFFDMQVTFLFPDWPTRFQDGRFRDFVTELIHERIPSHITNTILWLDRNQMESFETAYLRWENTKVKQDIHSDAYHLSEPAFDVYKQIQGLKTAM